MKKTLLVLLCLAGFVSAQGSQWIAIQSATPTPVEIKLLSSVNDVSYVRISTEGFSLHEVITPKGKAYTLRVEGTTPLLIKGAPDLPKVTTSLIIPDQDEMKAVIVSSKYKDFKDIDIAPSKGNLTRDIDPASQAYYYGKEYQKNSFWPKKTVETRLPYIVRDFRGQTLVMNVFSYNPVTRTLRVYYDITVKFSKTGKTGTNTLSRKSPLKKSVREFNELYSNQFLNYKSIKYTPLGEQGNILVISYGPFMAAMQPYVNWKIAEGYKTEIVDVATIGGAAAIKAYVSAYYNEPGLAYLLLVGDNQQVPTVSATAGDSDNSFGYIVGSDHYPDIFVGRFSGETETHITTQVAKVLYYEISPDTTTPWLRHGIGVASSQGPGDDNEMDYDHIRNLSTQIKNFTYDSVAEHFDGSQGGFDAPGDPTSSQVAADVNDGSGIMLYTGHGSDNAWSSSGFNSSDVAQLNNFGKLPFIWSVACVNGNFVNGTCFAEAWLRAKQGEELTGAVATLMSTINQSWDPPMEGMDEMVSILTESVAGNIKRTFGGLSMNGCMKMNDSYGSGGFEMTDTWNLFGDPSLMVRTAVPSPLVVTHEAVAFLGSTQFQVNCSHEGALVCISMNNEILGTANILGGTATISFPALAAIDNMKIVVTAFNMIPYIGQAGIIAASGPFVLMQSYELSDPSGNNNNYPDYGEEMLMDLSLKNLGVEIAGNVSASLSTSAAGITITDNTQIFGDINAGDVSNQAAAFAFDIADVTDMTLAAFTITITDDNGGSWNSNFNLIIHAPKLAITQITVNDAASGNGDGFLDPGETAEVVIATANVGHASTMNTTAILTCPWAGLTINNGNLDLGIINSGAATEAIYNVTLSNTAAPGSFLELNYVAGASIYVIQQAFFIQIGKVSEDFESGDLSQYSWTSGSDIPWTVSNISPYEGGYSARSGVINNSQTSTMSVTMEVLVEDSISFYRKVSSEEGYDYLQFYIDEAKIVEWSGTKAWQRVAYLVSPGLHTFSWKYSKDEYMSSGQDAAWVDFIEFPPVSLTTTGIEKPIQDSHFSLMPNPANTTVKLMLNTGKSAHNSLLITDLSGREIQNISLPYSPAGGIVSIDIDLADLSAGMYLVHYFNGQNLSTKKLIISR